MNTLTTLKTAISATLMASVCISSTALAGTAGGGGGESVLCYKSAAIKNEVLADIAASDRGAQVLTEANLQLNQLSQPPMLADIYESGSGQGLFSNGESEKPVVRTPDSVYQAIAKIDSRFWALFSSSVTSESQWAPNDAGVITVRDASFKNKFPANCTVVQVAYYDDATETVHFDRRITSRMASSQKVALKIHEDLYRFYRRGRSLMSGLASAANQSASVDNIPPMPVGLAMARLLGIDLPAATAFERAPVTSDSVRPMVAYLMKENVIKRTDFQVRAKAIAVKPIVRDRSWNRFNDYCLIYDGACVKISQDIEETASGALMFNGAHLDHWDLSPIFAIDLRKFNQSDLKM